MTVHVLPKQKLYLKVNLVVANDSKLDKDLIN